MLSKDTALKLVTSWCGGIWVLEIDGEEVTLKGKELLKAGFKHCTLVLGTTVCDAELVEIEGKDYDHGHTYSYTALEFEVKIWSAIGYIPVSLRYLLKRKLLNSPVYLTDMAGCHNLDNYIQRSK